MLGSCEDGLPDDTTCGVAVLDGTVMKILRVQDHLRQMGLGLAFMRSVAAVNPDVSVELSDGDYGLVGNLTKSRAETMQNDLRTLLTKARTEGR